ncbi:NAD-dependent epimerase/dehydratase family protein [Planomonospora parontospora]|uniref:NAD-dependent epimerase/dehydratase family protein n=1 Tax=Planomonospora parontospora TaxID=58119 RepID=UPI00166F76A0|nr:NAD-dependent epimerase/dehydratase family protein [Planomonospora parontospora]GGL59191.1 NAD-dependent dehydratase [Planomonospora parontospora subsp. antibiotica]GII20297.1 NAD-dependent dehydratase [Planomonospora parontospora subsp. antibiotica]
MSATRVLVTGGTGFIGSHLLRRLSLIEAEVHAVSRHTQDPKYGETWHVADLRDADATAKLFASARPEVVFHLASEVDGARNTGVVVPTLHSNLASTVNILTAAADRPDVKVVLAGSSEEPRPANGHAPAPSPYAMAKWAATEYGQLFHRLWDMPVTVLRPTMVYGPGQRDTRKVIPYVTLCLLRGQEPQLGSGSKPADWVYVEDVAEAFVVAGRSDKAAGRILDIGTGTGRPVKDAVELLFQIAGGSLRPRFGAIPDRPLDIAQIADTAPTAEVLGWRPAVGLEEGLRRTVAWYAGRLTR